MMRLDRRRFLGGVAGAAAIGGLLPAGCATTAPREGRPTNVLVVLADDLGWGDLWFTEMTR